MCRKMAAGGRFIVLALFWLGSSSVAADESVSELSAELRRLSQTVHQLQDLVAAQAQLIKELQAGGTPAAAAVPAKAPAQIRERGALGLSAFNPDIGVVADVVAKATQSGADDEGNDKISVRHLELILGHDVDPYSRFDATIALSDFEDVNLEEAYLTHWGLPVGLKGRFGRFYPRVGKDAAIHLDQLDTVEQSLVVTDLFGPEGFSRTGVDFSSFLPLPGEKVTHELSLGLLEGGVGHGGRVFGDTKRYPTYYGHLRNFWDISELSSFELGGTYLLGHSDDHGEDQVHVFGLHTALLHHVSPVNRLKLQFEAYFQNRDRGYHGSVHDHNHHRQAWYRHDEHHDADHEEEEHHRDDDETGSRSPWGFYLLSDYRLSPHWGLGGRFDYNEATALTRTAEQRADLAYAGYLSFYQSEFARWRGQYQYVDFADGGHDHRFFLQGTFAIGVHQHQLQ